MTSLLSREYCTTKREASSIPKPEKEERADLIVCLFLLKQQEIYGNISNRSNRVTRWTASQTYKRWEVVHMTTYEAISLMIAFGTLIIALLAYIDRKNKQK